MNQTRTFLLLALCFVAYLLFNQWMGDYHQPPPAPAPTVATTPANPGDAPANTGSVAPGTNASGSAPATTGATPAQIQPTLVSVTSDVLRLTIDTRGGKVVSAYLLGYPQKLGSEQSVRMLSNVPSHLYEAQSWIQGEAGNAAPGAQAVFRAEQTSYQLAPGQKQLTVDLRWTSPSGITVQKRYTVERGSYAVKLSQTISNASQTTWQGRVTHRFERVDPPEPEYSNWLAKYSDQTRYSFFGAAWYSPEDKFNKVKFDEIKDHPLSNGGKPGRSVTGGWIAMEQPYFVGAWLLEEKLPHYFITAQSHLEYAQPHSIIASTGPLLSVAPGQKTTSSARLYLGPKLPEVMKSVEPSFELALNYGMMTVVARPLHWILAQLHKLTHNWGWAIVLLVLLINALCYKLYALQYRSSARMRQLKPRMDALKERFGDDKQKLQQATMELYKKEKVNPVSGCLPVLITIPIFFGLYELLRESVELRQAPFIGWIHDLSAADPYFVLPILYGLVMLVQSWLMPITAGGMDSGQQKMMRYMPVASAAFFAFFPAGLALYYFVSGLSRLVIQWWVYRQVDKEDAKRKEAKAKEREAQAKNVKSAKNAKPAIIVESADDDTQDKDAKPAIASEPASAKVKGKGKGGKKGKGKGGKGKS